MLFLLNKIYVRKLIHQDDFPNSLKVISLSIPNFFEAILGTSIFVMILLSFKHKKVIFIKRIRDLTLKLVGIAISAVYVISQELKYHNLGGNNVYDINDLIASIIGLLFISFIILKFGIDNLDKKIS